MKAFELPDWEKVFVPDGPLLESFLRGTLVYFGVLFLFRVVLKRQRGSVGFGDVMLLLLVSEGVSQALTQDFRSVPNGVVAAGSLLFWTFVTDFLCYRSHWAQKVFQSDPVQLVRDGEVLTANMEKELIDVDELACQLRRKGYDNLTQVKSVFIEPEGEVSVVPHRGPVTATEPEEDVPSSNPPDFDATMRKFLDAAHRLHQAAVWHDERATEHKRHAAEAREALKRFGVQPRALLTAEANGTHPEGSEAAGAH